MDISEGQAQGVKKPYHEKEHGICKPASHVQQSCRNSSSQGPPPPTRLPLKKLRGLCLFETERVRKKIGQLIQSCGDKHPTFIYGNLSCLIPRMSPLPTLSVLQIDFPLLTTAACFNFNSFYFVSLKTIFFLVNCQPQTIGPTEVNIMIRKLHHTKKLLYIINYNHVTHL